MEALDTNYKAGELPKGSTLGISENTKRVYVSDGAEELTIIPYEGKTQKLVADASNKCFELHGVRDLEIDGSIEGHEYGLMFDGDRRCVTLYLRSQTHNAYIGSLIITGGNEGIGFKTQDPDLSVPRDLSIRDSYIFDIKNEPLYIGHLSNPMGLKEFDIVTIKNVTLYDVGWDVLQAKHGKNLIIENVLGLKSGTADVPRQRNGLQIEDWETVTIRNSVIYDMNLVALRFRKCKKVLFENCLIGYSKNGSYCDGVEGAVMTFGKGCYITHMGYMQEKPVFNSLEKEKAYVEILDGVIFDKSMEGYDFGYYKGKLVFEDIPPLEIGWVEHDNLNTAEPVVHGFYKDKGMGKNFTRNHNVFDVSEYIVDIPVIEKEPVVSKPIEEAPKPEVLPVDREKRVLDATLGELADALRG